MDRLSETSKETEGLRPCCILNMYHFHDQAALSKSISHKQFGFDQSFTKTIILPFTYPCFIKCL